MSSDEWLYELLGEKKPSSRDKFYNIVGFLGMQFFATLLILFNLPSLNPFEWFDKMNDFFMVGAFFYVWNLIGLFVFIMTHKEILQHHKKSS